MHTRHQQLNIHCIQRCLQQRQTGAGIRVRDDPEPGNERISSSCQDTGTEQETVSEKIGILTVVSTQKSSHFFKNESIILQGIHYNLHFTVILSFYKNILII